MSRPVGVRFPAQRLSPPQRTQHCRQYVVPCSCMSPHTLSRTIRTFPERPPFTTDFESVLHVRGTWTRTGVWYGSQREHWIGWLRGYHGPGAYRRKKWNGDAEFAYNHLLCPPMVLWLGEACGIPKKMVKRAMNAGLAAPSSLPAICAAIRRQIPWESIERRLKG